MIPTDRPESILQQKAAVYLHHRHEHDRATQDLQRLAAELRDAEDRLEHHKANMDLAHGMLISSMEFWRRSQVTTAGQLVAYQPINRWSRLLRLPELQVSAVPEAVTSVQVRAVG